ncbi:hypothetical protein [Gimesia chilikensis]|uniref:ATPase AAA-type core domain-containing protein n=1 Tax=Gimesia chilikensis TaxID=2605989 RepID=A0A517PYG4_9PLAN|nr:hypothetical protein [Gimesia chilikensis]QDT24410.1 hypothetical protein HG66A1_62420 [Gimesia chilikensis]
MESSQIKTSLEKKQELLSHHVRLVAKKMSHSLLIYGAQGGMGKSRTVLQVLDEYGVDPVLINSHITPLALYGVLWQHREDSILFFDDVDSMFSSMPHLGLLRSALWGSPRIVTYNSSQLSNLPSSFEFTSRVIFAVNVIPKNDAFKAVLSRCDQFELSATNGEVIEMMRNLSSEGFHGVTPDECVEVIDYIESNAEDRQLSLRLLGPSLRKLKYAHEEGIDWRPLIKSQLSSLGRKQVATKRLDNKSADAKVMKQAIEKHPESPADQQTFFCNTTGKSRASFFRARQRYLKMQEESE